MLEDLIKESLPEIKKEIIEKISFSLYNDIKNDLKHDITAIVRESIRPMVQEITNELITENVIKDHKGELVTVKEYIKNRLMTSKNKYGIDIRELIERLVDSHAINLIESEIRPEISQIKQKIKQALSDEIALRITSR